MREICTCSLKRDSVSFNDPLVVSYMWNEPSFKSQYVHYLLGLQVELFLEQEEYIAELTEGAGMRVTIHANDRMPFPEDDGLLVAPGTQTHMALRVVK